MAGATTIPDLPAATGRLRRRLRRRRRRNLVVAVACGLGGLLAGLLAGSARPALQAPDPDPPNAGAVSSTDQGGDTPDQRGTDQRGPDQQEPGTRVVAVARPMALPPLEPGDQVELMAVSDDGLGRSTVRQVGPAVPVVAVDGAVVAVAVPAASVRDLLAHQAAGRIEIVVVP